jgi:hypothetical protein
MTGRLVTINGTQEPASRAQPTRSAHVICELTRLAVCGFCWAASLHPCATGVGEVEGYHLARFTRAWSRGLISDGDLALITAAAGSGSESALIYDDIPANTTGPQIQEPRP